MLCAANFARSQMAEGLMRHDFGDQFEANSAGSHATSVRPEAIQVMKEIGIDISGHRSKSIDEFAGESFDDVLTVCDDTKESCPIFPGHANHFHHSFEDPAVANGSQEEKLAVFRRVRDEIREYLKEFAIGKSD
jgi:arsenate reductase (thioredoxin)